MMNLFNQQIQEKYTSLTGVELSDRNDFASANTYSKKESNKKLVNKSYMFKNGMIIESVFDTLFLEDIFDFCQDYFKQSNNNIILVANDTMHIQNNMLVNIILKLKPKHSFFVDNTKCDKTSNSLPNLIKKAYNKAKDGSTLLICDVETSFDLLSYVF